MTLGGGNPRENFFVHCDDLNRTSISFKFLKPIDFFCLLSALSVMEILIK